MTKDDRRFVFIVRDHAYDDQGIWGVFDTLELAVACYEKARVASRWGETVGIERFTVNPTDDDDDAIWVYPLDERRAR
ncbi:MAG TPA: hypothetical protein VFL82_03485 [Thermomicrobiales bacterium]|nr:hypothetical protein [Thermomicrobiales bacterium]